MTTPASTILDDTAAQAIEAGPGQHYDLCSDGVHYARCDWRPFKGCSVGFHWHYVLGETAYRAIGTCPQAGEHGEPADQPCQPLELVDYGAGYAWLRPERQAAS